MRIDLLEVQKIAQTQDRNELVYKAASYYISQGIPVIPIPFGEKHVNSKSIYTAMCSARQSKIDEWFDPKSGPHRGCNIALGCGDYYGKGGIFVVDVDNKYSGKYGDNPWGIKAWEALEDQHGSVYGPVQRTPSGGLHVVAQWRENLTPSQNKVAFGVDTRGGHVKKISSHIMAWPSVVDDVEYRWEKGGDIAITPNWIADLMGVSWKTAAKAVGGRGSENITVDDVETQITLEKARNILFTINPDDLDYEEWVKTGQALHSQHPDSDGLALWDSWSSQGERYEMDECAVRWKGFNPNGPVRMATLFYIAQNRGTASKIVAPEEGSEEGVLCDVIDEYNSKYALVLLGEQAKVIKKEQVPKSIQMQYNTYAIDAFRAYYSNDLISIPDGKGGEKPVKKFDLWMSSPRRLSFDGMMLNPSEPRVVELGMHRYLNTWAGFAVYSEEGDWELLKAHIFKNLCRSNRDHYEWLMDWMADMFQEPADPKGCAVILGGVEGAGKGTLANAIAKIFGIHAAIVSNAKHLTSQFNSMIMDSVFLFADEVVYAGNHEAASQLKAMVTEKTNTREKKFGDQKRVDTFLHIMMATNNEWKVAAGPESRRWFILDVLTDSANDREYFGAIKAQLENGGYEAMLYELQNRVILSNLRFAPETEELKRQRTLMQVQSIYDSFPAWLSYVIDIEHLGVEDLDFVLDMEHKEGEGGWPVLADKSALWESYAEWSRKYKARAPIMATSVFFKRLGDLGFSDGPRKRVGNNRIRSLEVPKYPDLCKKAEKIHAIYRNENPPKEEESEM